MHCSALTSTRQCFLSFQHLTTLLASCDMQVVLSVLNLLYVFSKRSNYITRLGSDKRTPLLARLQHLAEVWKWLFFFQARLRPYLKWRVDLLVFLLSSVELGRQREWFWPRWVLQGSAHDGENLSSLDFIKGLVNGYLLMMQYAILFFFFILPTMIPCWCVYVSRNTLQVPQHCTLNFMLNLDLRSKSRER